MAKGETPTGMLRDEHQVILRVLGVFEGLLREGDDGEWDFDGLERCITFFRAFADACHHGKEEDLLFPELESRGMSRAQGPIAVMLFEHKQGRALVGQMADALEPARAGDLAAVGRIENAGRAYIQLLRGHIHKEDNVLFEMADHMVDREACQQLCRNYDVVCARHFEGQTKDELEKLAAELEAGRSGA